MKTIRIRCQAFQHAADWIEALRKHHPRYYKRRVKNAAITVIAYT